MNDGKERAMKWLQVLLVGNDQYDWIINYIREAAIKGNFPLTNIDTSEEELEQLRIKGCITDAFKWLGYLRDGAPYQYDWVIGHIRKLAARGKFSLADIGTSEEELEQLRIKGCIADATKWLNSLRMDNDQKDWIVRHIRELAIRGNFLLVDIGTNEEELSSFLEVPVKPESRKSKWRTTFGYVRLFFCFNQNRL